MKENRQGIYNNVFSKMFFARWLWEISSGIIMHCLLQPKQERPGYSYSMGEYAW